MPLLEEDCDCECVCVSVLGRALLLVLMLLGVRLSGVVEPLVASLRRRNRDIVCDGPCRCLACRVRRKNEMGYEVLVVVLEVGKSV